MRKTQDQRDAAAAAILAKNEIITRCEAVMQSPATQELLRVLQAGCPRGFSRCKLHDTLHMGYMHLRREEELEKRKAATPKPQPGRKKKRLAAAERIKFVDWIMRNGQETAESEKDLEA